MDVWLRDDKLFVNGQYCSLERARECVYEPNDEMRNINASNSALRKNTVDHKMKNKTPQTPPSSAPNMQKPKKQLPPPKMPLLTPIKEQKD